MKVLISSTISKNLRKSVEIAKNLGLGIELSRVPHVLSDKIPFEEVLAEIKDIFDDFKGEKSLHGFFFDLSVASIDDDIKAVSIKRYMQSLDIAKAMGARTIVFHTGNESTIKHVKFQADFIEYSIDFWKQYICEFEKAGITASIENVSENTYEPISKVITAVNSPYLKATVDVGHVNVHSTHPAVEWIKGYGKNLYHMHLHNNYTDNDSHLSLLKGTVDYDEIFATLRELKLNPLLVLEIFTEKDLYESVDYLKKIGVIDEN